MTRQGSGEEDVPEWFDPLLFMDDADAWQELLARTAAARDETFVAPVPTDEERADDDRLWQEYKDRKQARQDEVSQRSEAAKRALIGLGRLTSQQRGDRERFVLDCPDRKKCRLYTAYAWSPPPGAPMPVDEVTLLVVARTRHGQRAAYPEWFLSGDDVDRTDWFLPVGCRHGEGTFPIDVPGGALSNYYFTANSPRLRRSITALTSVSGVEWTPVTSML